MIITTWVWSNRSAPIASDRAWSQLGDHCRNYPDRLYFEFLNEPSGALTDDKWQEAMLTLLRTVRQANPTRIVVIEPGYWNSLDHLVSGQLPTDDGNIIVTFHCYILFKFTHRGGGLVHGSDKLKGTSRIDSPELREQN